MIPWSVKTRKNIHRGGIKINKNTMHTYFPFCTSKNIVDRHPARIMPIRKYFETHKND